MADRKISDLTALTTPASGDFLPIVDISEAAAASKNKRITIEELFRGVPLGTAAAPSIAIEGDEDTGVFSPGANQLAVATNGVKRIEIQADGDIDIDGGGVFYDATNNRLGIGSTGPVRKLHVAVAGSDPQLRLQDTSATESIWAAIEFNGDTNRQAFIGKAGSSDLLIVNDNASGALRFSTNATERGRFTSDGKFLVGTSTASSAGTYAQYCPIKIQGNSSSSTGTGCLNIARGVAAASITSGSGIGTISFSDSSGNEFAWIACEADANAGASDYPGRLVFSTTADSASSPTERMRISSAGKLTVPGVYNGTTSGGSAVYVEADGDLLRFTSSRKYKTDIETIEDEKADAILECRPVWYRSLSQNDIKTEGATKSDWGWYGFIAEEVAEIDPRLVSWATKDAVPQEDGSLKSIERDPVDYEAEGVRYDNFVPLLLNLIKRQKEQIEAMEARLTALETA